MEMIIKVKVRKGEARIEEKDGCVIIYTNAPRERNKANYDIIKQLSKYYGKDVRNIKIIRGGTSSDKIIEIL